MLRGAFLTLSTLITFCFASFMRFVSENLHISFQSTPRRILFLRKSKVQFVLTNLKTFDPSSFIIIKNKTIIMNRQNCQKFLPLVSFEIKKKLCYPNFFRNYKFVESHGNSVCKSHFVSIITYHPRSSEGGGYVDVEEEYRSRKHVKNPFCFHASIQHELS